jgi:hypothetical protein
MAKKKNSWDKVLTESWVANSRTLTEEDAEKQIVGIEFEIKQILHDKEENQELKAAKEILKDLNAGFSCALKYEKAKIEFLLEHIENIRVKTKTKVQ